MHARQPVFTSKIAKNIKLQGIRWSLRAIGFPNHFTHCIPSPNRLTIFFSYKKRSWGLIYNIKKENKETLPKSLPLLAQVLHPFLRFGLNIPPPALSPYTTLSLSQRDQLVVRGNMGMMHLEQAIRGAWTWFVERFVNKKVVIFLIFILNKRIISCPNTLCLYIFID
jgi:hypothetical protein